MFINVPPGSRAGIIPLKFSKYCNLTFSAHAMIQLASAVIEIPQKSDVVTFSAFQKMSKKPKQTEFVMVLTCRCCCSTERVLPLPNLMIYGKWQFLCIESDYIVHRLCVSWGCWFSEKPPKTKPKNKG